MLADDEIAQVVADRTPVTQIMVPIDALVKATYRLRFGDESNADGRKLVKGSVDVRWWRGLVAPLQGGLLRLLEAGLLFG